MSELRSLHKNLLTSSSNKFLIFLSVQNSKAGKGIFSASFLMLAWIKDLKKWRCTTLVTANNSSVDEGSFKAPIFSFVLWNQLPLTLKSSSLLCFMMPYNPSTSSWNSKFCLLSSSSSLKSAMAFLDFFLFAGYTIFNMLL